MKILYISRGDHIDYQDDCLCIGLKELFGSDVVDINKRCHIYDTYDADKVKSLYGKGMSVTRILPDLEVDRTDIQNKIKTRYFDYIVYGSIWRCSADIQKVLQYYPKNRILVVDGEDEQHIHKTYDLGILYFKRELIYNAPRLLPISFAIPTSKIRQVHSKKIGLAICDPRDRSTYIYNDESSYYNGYAEACFGVTMKKAGWDCMRHYEILANNCIPWFIDIDQCPDNTMVNFPKALCKEVNNKLGGNHTYPKQWFNVWDEYQERFHEASKKNTTLNLATYVLDSVRNLN